MKINDNFDIFNNADPETIERLSEYNSFSKKDMKRIFTMSEKKYRRQKINFSPSSDTDNSADIEDMSVEHYSRPKYYKKIFAASVCLLTVGVAVLGIAAVNRLNGDNVNNRPDPFVYSAPESSTSRTDTTSESAPATEPVTKETAAASTSDIFTATTYDITDNAPDVPGQTQTTVTEPPPSDIQSPSSGQPDDTQSGEDQTMSEIYKARADQLLIELNNIEKIGGCNIPVDIDDSFTDSDGNTFSRVAGTQFACPDDIVSYILSNVTEDLFYQRYSGISSKYINVNGQLYVQDTPTGSGFNWLNTEREIINANDSSFSVLAEFEWYGGSQLMNVEIVLDNGIWKINSFSSI